jgi:HEAT repeat protein
MNQNPEMSENRFEIWRARLRDKDHLVHLGALAELYLLESIPLQLIDSIEGCLQDADLGVRKTAVAVLSKIGPLAAPSLTKGLSDDQPTSLRIDAASALGRIGSNSEPAIEALCKCFESEDETLRWHAGFALGKIGPAAVPSLRKMLQSPNSIVVTSTVNAIEWLGTNAMDLLVDIRALLEGSSDPLLRISCCAAIAKMTGDFSEILPLMQPILKERDPGPRKTCVDRIGILGPLAKDAAPFIFDTLEDPSPEVRAAGVLALSKIRPDAPQAVPRLIDRLSDPEDSVKRNAAIAISAYGTEASGAVSALESMRQGSDTSLATIASATLKAILGAG